jgi:hypothetical protein
MPWLVPGTPPPKLPSTGDQIFKDLAAQTGPADPLGGGIHLHWGLPDFFSRGQLAPDGSDMTLQPAPNRWLVLRYLSLFDAAAGDWAEPVPTGFVVESDYVTASLEPEPSGIIRPAVAVPLPAGPASGTQPFMYLGRVVPYDTWDPSGEDPSDFLASHAGDDGKPLTLTSLGFVGPTFAPYYPECRSVFGFWDHFEDVAFTSSGGTTLYQAIRNDIPVRFKASYQVIGWFADPSADPMAEVSAAATARFDDYLARCKANGVTPSETWASTFVATVEDQCRWTFDPGVIDSAATSGPAATLCAGIVQEVVWDTSSSGSLSFLTHPDSTAPSGASAVWSDTTRLAVGSSTEEALSALLDKDMASSSDPPVLQNYEYLLDALQLGLLNDLEVQPSKLIHLDEGLHDRAFAGLDGGLLWVVQPARPTGGGAQDADQEVTLPLGLAEDLSLLNAAQKAYDQARASVLVQRSQLFMDWVRFATIDAAGDGSDPYVALQDVMQFVQDELTAVQAAGSAAGVLQYVSSSSGQVTGCSSASDPASLAGAVVSQHAVVAEAVGTVATWTLEAVAAPPFFLPSDPVLVMEGDRLAPARRNGSSRTIGVRLTSELLSSVTIESGGATFPVLAAQLAGMPAITPQTPNRSDVAGLVAEAHLVVPMLADRVITALSTAGGAGNPAAGGTGSYERCLAAFRVAQGGQSQLDGAPQDPYPPTGRGLFAAVRAAPPAADPTEQVTTPIPLTVTFHGWPPNAVAWSCQRELPAFSSPETTRYDPFLPLMLSWTVHLRPLAPGAGDDYGATDITDNFQLTVDDVDYSYLLDGGVPTFPKPADVPYSGWSIISSKPAGALGGQIDTYIRTYPDDPTDPSEPNPAIPALRDLRALYAERTFLSVALNGFNVQQLLQSYLPQTPVQDLVDPSDDLTPLIASAVEEVQGDNWYDHAFNNVLPVFSGPRALENFGPIRAGFLAIASLEVVDVFGQRMTLGTLTTNGDGSLDAFPSLPLRPLAGDTKNGTAAYLAPRLLAPSRLWFRWLSATHDAGATGDFVEMNTHPATSPVCGWIVPDHLDQSLLLYDATGLPIGSFGLEHGVMTYRTRAGNPDNPRDELDKDIGTAGTPTVNPHVANFMWYLDGAGATGTFFADLLAAIGASDTFIAPASFAQDAELAVLIGRPLAITRAVLGLETSGGILPLSQADTSPTDPFPRDVKADNADYVKQRQAGSSASLASVQFPIRLGELADLDDGLVGYLKEEPGPQPYDVFYSAAAVPEADPRCRQPTPADLELTLNAPPVTVTMLVDPRAAVHATTGILPVAALAVPSDQYAQAMGSLAVTFFTNPVLTRRQGLVVPVPQETGWQWSWVDPPDADGGEVAPPLPLAANAANDAATYEYSPQALREGWLRLSPASTPGSDPPT